MPRGGAAFLSRSVAFSFDGDAVQQLGAWDVLDVLEDLCQVLDIVAINGTKVPEVERFKEVGLLEQSRLHCRLDFLSDGLCVGAKLGDASEQVPHFILDLVVGFGCGDVRQVFFECTDIGVDGHAVVIQHHQQVGVFGAAVVEAFKGQSGGHGSIANDGDVFLVVLSAQLARHGHAKRSRNGG